MKKMIITAVFFMVVSFLGADSALDKLSGEWYTEPFLMEQDSGLLTAFGADYAFPYRGIEKINFLDSGFVVFTVSGIEYRAFYEVETLDFDNFHILCNFKNGEEFILKLVETDRNDWTYLYRISGNSILRGPSEPGEDIETPEEVMEEATFEEEAVEEKVPESLYLGILKRK